MSHRRVSGSDAIHVKPTNDLPPENPFPNPGNNPGKATDVDYIRVDTEPPCEKIRGSPSSSSGNGISYSKTELCCEFLAGNYPYVGSTCHFAHTVEELRPPSSRQGTPAETRGEFKIPAESGRLYTGRPCKFYSKEGCPFGESCKFSHDESSRNRESCAISLGPRGHGAGDGGNVAQIVRRKTGICYKWEATKSRPHGTDCRFAHGAAKLHRFGGGLVQGEGTIGTSSTPETKQTGQAEKVTSFVSPGVPSQRVSNAVTQNPKGVRIRGKWKGPDNINKINLIYGDWIEDPRKGVFLEF